MTKQAQVGAFAILALLLLFGVFYVITDFGTRHTGYKTGIHFTSAAGLHSGALVYFSGVTVGTVDSIVLLPDHTVDVILAVNRDVDIPRDSKFLIQAPLTGDPTMVIVPPAPARADLPVLPRQVLAVEEQPHGTNAATIADLLQEGQGEIKRLDSMLADLERREPRLLDTMQATLDNANALTTTANRSVDQLSSTLQQTLTAASANVIALTDTLNNTATVDSKRVDAILAQLQTTSVSLDKSMASLQDLATNRDLKANILATTKNIADTTETISELTRDLRTITGDPQTQGQVKNTVANLDATMQRANSLLGALGGTSSVYGVDAGATPYPATQVTPAPPYPMQTYPPGSLATPSAQRQQQIKARLGALAKNLVSLRVRVTGLSKERVCCQSPLFTSDRGPQTDIDAVLLPHGSTSVVIGAKNIGANTTVDFAALQSVSPSLRVGGGVLYSRLGVLTQYNSRIFGIEGRLYDPRRPELDLIGNLNVTHGLQLLFGSRGVNHVERRTVYGVQLQFP